MDENETRIFECDLNDTNLFSCILEDIGEEDISAISTTSSIINEKAFINCINASLVTCLRNNREELDFPKVQLKTKKNESGEWLIKQINIIVDKEFDDNLIFEKVNQCLKFVKKACGHADTVQMSIINTETMEDLKYYKVKLLEIDKLFQEIKDDKSKKEELFSLFRNIGSNK